MARDDTHTHTCTHAHTRSLSLSLSLSQTTCVALSQHFFPLEFGNEAQCRSLCVCVCVCARACVREREREREKEKVYMHSCFHARLRLRWYVHVQAQREREDCIRSLRIFDLRCNHFIIYTFLFFYFMRGLGLYRPLAHTLPFFFEKICKISQNLHQKKLSNFSKNTYFLRLI